MRFAQYFLEKFKSGCSPFQKIVTGNEAWFEKYGPETQKKSMVRSPDGANPPNKAKQQKSAKRVMNSIYFTRKKDVAAIPFRKGLLTSALVPRSSTLQVLGISKNKKKFARKSDYH